jgi:phage baseplate assembly protein W
MSTYRDFDISFKTHPVTGDLVMKNDMSAILQSIRNLILTSAGEILWEPNIGGGINKMMFELNYPLMRIQLYDKIMTTIGMFEPRVEIIDLDIRQFENGHGIYVKLEFHALNNPETIVETIPIKRTR